MPAILHARRVTRDQHAGDRFGLGKTVEESIPLQRLANQAPDRVNAGAGLDLFIALHFAGRPTRRLAAICILALRRQLPQLGDLFRRTKILQTQQHEFTCD